MTPIHLQIVGVNFVTFVTFVGEGGHHCGCDLRTWCSLRPNYQKTKKIGKIRCSRGFRRNCPFRPLELHEGHEVHAHWSAVCIGSGVLPKPLDADDEGEMGEERLNDDETPTHGVNHCPTRRRADPATAKNWGLDHAA